MRRLPRQARARTGDVPPGHIVVDGSLVIPVKSGLIARQKNSRKAMFDASMVT
jgi:hypothetical protein